MTPNSQRLGVLCIFLSLCAACASTTPLRVSHGGSSDMPPECLALAKDPSDFHIASCTAQTYQSAGLRDRARAGQRLALLTQALPPEQREDTLRVAFWLNPNLGIPQTFKDLRAIAAKLDGEDILTEPVPDGAMLAFKHATNTSSWDGPVYTVPIQLKGAQPSSPLDQRDILSIAASATGADAADAGGGWVPASAFSSSLVGLTITPLSRQRSNQASIRSLRRMDVALSKGFHTEAAFASAKALEKLPKDAPPCETVETIHAIRALLQDDIEPESSEQETSKPAQLRNHQASCLKEPNDPRGALVGEYWGEWAFLKEHHRAVRLEERPTSWLRSEDFAAYQKRVQTLISKLPPLPAQRLQTLLDAATLRVQYRDDPCSEEPFKKQMNALRNVAQRLDALGRHDLALKQTSSPIQDALADSKPLHADMSRELLATLRAPEHAWMRQGVILEGLMYSAFGAGSSVDVTPLTPLCKAYFDSLREDIKRDTFPDASSRNAWRLFTATFATTSCPVYTDTVRDLEQTILAQAVREDQGAGVLYIFVNAFGQIVQSMLSGQSNNVTKVLVALDEGIDMIEKDASSVQNPDAQDVLKAITLSSRAIIRRFLQNDNNLAVQTAPALKTLHTVASKPLPKDAPTLVRYAPILRSVLLLFHTLDFGLQGDTQNVQKTLNTFDQTLDADLERLFALLETPNYSPSAAGIIRSIEHLAQVALNNSPQTRSKALAHLNTLQPQPNERGHWALGFGALRTIVWDVYAFLSFDEASPKRSQNAVQNASKSLSWLIERSLEDFDLLGTSWEGFRILPKLHDIGAALILDSQAKDDADLLNTLRIALKGSQKDLKDQINQGKSSIQTESGGTQTLLYALLDILDTSLRIASNPKTTPSSFLPNLTQALNTSSSDYSKEAQLYLQVTLAYLNASDDPSNALRAVQNAYATSQKTHLNEFGYIPPILLARAMLQNSKAYKPKEILDTVELALSHGDAHQACLKGHAVHAALPTKAWALERMGQHTQAEDAFALYFKLVDAGFSGDGSIACSFVSESSQAIFSATVNQSTFVPTSSSDGTFQVNFGFQSNDYTQERFTCSGYPAGTPRYDRVIAAALIRALYAWNAGDDATAQRAIDRALYESNALIHGTPVVLGPMQASSLETSRKAVSLPLLSWASFVARFRGDTLTAMRLQFTHSALKKFAEPSEDEDNATPKLPFALRGLERYQNILPIYTQWSQGKLSVKDLKALGKETSPLSKSPLFSPWSVQLGTTQLFLSETGEFDLFKAATTKGRAPAQDAEAQAIQTLWSLILTEKPDPATFQSAFDTLHSKRPVEAFLLSQVLLSRAQSLGSKAPTTLFKDAGRVAPSYLWIQATERSNASNILSNPSQGPKALETLQGRIQPEAELQIRFGLLSTLLRSTQTHPKAQEIIATTQPILRRATGPYSSNTLILQSLGVCLEILEGQNVDAQIAHMQAALTKAQDLPPSLRTLTENLNRTQDPKQRKAIAEDFINTFLRSQ